jgi:GMP synthase (glutamine-hydrolysing)
LIVYYSVYIKVMKKDILILKNISREGPGLIEDVLIEHNLRHEIIEPDQISHIISIENLGAMIVLGGPNSANDSDTQMKSELDLIRKVINAGIPYLGICLGMQTMIKANGGQVVKCLTKEIGFRNHYDEFYKISLTPQGRRDNLFKNLPDEFTVFQLHGETVILQPNMSLLASGDTCENQIVKIGANAYGIQCHFELKAEMLDLWIDHDEDLNLLDRENVRTDYQNLRNDYQKTGKQLIENFLSIAGCFAPLPLLVKLGAGSKGGSLRC